MSGTFHLRTAKRSSDFDRDDESDGMFVIHAFDSALAYLASIGSAAQWGTQPFSDKPQVVADMLDYVETSATSPEADKGWKRMVIAETEGTRVAVMGLSTEIPSYVPQEVLARDRDDFLYLNYLVIDRRTGQLAKGSGGDLVKEAIREYKARGKTRLLSDCWRGNGDGLMKYYVAQGFSVVAEISVPGKHGKGLPWNGYVLEIKLDTAP